MTINRIRAPGWGIGEKLTSAQMNGVDLNTTYALDKRTGQTDSLGSRVTETGPGRVVPIRIAGANASTLYSVTQARWIDVGDTNITASRTYTLAVADAISGDTITIFCRYPNPQVHTITVVDEASGLTLATLGTAGTQDASWATFVFDAAAWNLGPHGTNDIVNTWARNMRGAPAVNLMGNVPSVGAAAIRYVPGQREWLAFDYFTSNALRVVREIFDDWPATDVLTDPAWNSLPTASADGDASGNRVVIMGNIDRGSVYNGSAWSNISGITGADHARPCVVWEPVSNTWIVVSGGPTSVAVATSTDRVAWTNRSNPFPLGTECTLEVDRAGTAVMAGYNGSTLYLSTSTNGGVTWSGAVSFALGFIATREHGLWQRPVWTGTRWLVWASNTAVTSTRIYTSDDAVNWTLLSTLSSWSVYSMAAIGRVAMATVQRSSGSLNDVAVSDDGGVTWRLIDRRFTAFVGFVGANQSRFIVSGSSRVYPSLAIGAGETLLT